MLARAYGPLGVLFNEICMLSVWTREAAAQLLGLTLHEINCITDALLSVLRGQNDSIRESGR